MQPHRHPYTSAPLLDFASAPLLREVSRSEYVLTAAADLLKQRHLLPGTPAVAGQDAATYDLLEASLEKLLIGVFRLLSEAEPDLLRHVVRSPTPEGAAALLARWFERQQAAGTSALTHRLALLEEQSRLLREAGGALSTDEVARLLGGISRQAVEKRRDRGSLLAVRLNEEVRYPACQFDVEAGATLAGWERVMRAFTVDSPWTRLSVLLTPHPALEDRRPIDVLRAGDVQTVGGIAAGFGETGA